jgi:hydrogenase maturation protease
MSGPVLVIAAGNDARGDDGLGPSLLKWIEAAAFPGVRTVLDFQLQIEHALEIAEARLALFIDAHCAQTRAAVLRQIGPAASPAVASHALHPDQVLAVADKLGLARPPAFLLGLAGAEFGLGQGLSSVGAESLAAGMELAARLLMRPEGGFWSALAV